MSLFEYLTIRNIFNRKFIVQEIIARAKRM